MLPNIITASLFSRVLRRRMATRTRLSHTNVGSHGLQKFLARTATRLQDRSAMSTFARSTNRGRTFVATCVFAAFVWALALSASPQLHQRVHADAPRAEHSCAVTAIVSGNYDCAAQAPLITPPDFISQFGKVLALTSAWVQPLFLKAHIFANAPPALG